MRTGSFTVSRKITLLLGVLGVLLIVVTTISFVRHREIDAGYSRILERDGRALLVVPRMTVLLHDAARITRERASAPGRNPIVRTDREFAVLRQKMAEETASLRQALPEYSRPAADIEHAFDALLRLGVAAVPASRDNRDGFAWSIEFNRRFDLLAGYFRALGDRVRQGMVDQARQCEAATRQLIRRTLLAAVLALAAGLVIAHLWVWHSLARPLRQLVDVVRRLSAGDTNVTIQGGERTDEVGSLASAIGVLRQNLARKQRLEEEEQQRATSDARNPAARPGQPVESEGRDDRPARAAEAGRKGGEIETGPRTSASSAIVVPASAFHSVQNAPPPPAVSSTSRVGTGSTARTATSRSFRPLAPDRSATSPPIPPAPELQPEPEPRDAGIHEVASPVAEMSADRLPAAETAVSGALSDPPAVPEQTGPEQPGLEQPPAELAQGKSVSVDRSAPGPSTIEVPAAMPPTDAPPAHEPVVTSADRGLGQAEPVAVRAQEVESPGLVAAAIDWCSDAGEGAGLEAARPEVESPPAAPEVVEPRESNTQASGTAVEPAVATVPETPSPVAEGERNSAAPSAAGDSAGTAEEVVRAKSRPNGRSGRRKIPPRDVQLDLLAPEPQAQPASAATAPDDLRERVVAGQFPGVDIADAVQRLGLARAEIERMLAEFGKGLRRELKGLREAVEDSNPEEARRLAHGFAGAAGNLSAHELRRHAKTIELAIKFGHGNLEGMLDDLEREAERFQAGLEVLAQLRNGPLSTEPSEDSPGQGPV